MRGISACGSSSQLPPPVSAPTFILCTYLCTSYCVIRIHNAVSLEFETSFHLEEKSWLFMNNITISYEMLNVTLIFSTGKWFYKGKFTLPWQMPINIDNNLIKVITLFKWPDQHLPFIFSQWKRGNQLAIGSCYSLIRQQQMYLLHWSASLH